MLGVQPLVKYLNVNLKYFLFARGPNIPLPPFHSSNLSWLLIDFFPRKGEQFPTLRETLENILREVGLRKSSNEMRNNVMIFFSRQASIVEYYSRAWQPWLEFKLKLIWILWNLKRGTTTIWDRFRLIYKIIKGFFPWGLHVADARLPSPVF